MVSFYILRHCGLHNGLTSFADITHTHSTAGHQLATAGPRRHQLATANHHRRRRKTFPVSFFGEPKKRSSHLDLQDLPHHSPPRPAATSSAATTAVVNTPPKPQCIHHHHHPDAVHSVTIIFISSPSTTDSAPNINDHSHHQPPLRPRRAFGFGFSTAKVRLVFLSGTKGCVGCRKPQIRVRWFRL
nr:hypothetical protein [Tanacetum cinerariifolium]